MSIGFYCEFFLYGEIYSFIIYIKPIHENLINIIESIVVFSDDIFAIFNYAILTSYLKINILYLHDIIQVSLQYYDSN